MKKTKLTTAQRIQSNIRSFFGLDPKATESELDAKLQEEIDSAEEDDDEDEDDNSQSEPNSKKKVEASDSDDDKSDDSDDETESDDSDEDDESDDEEEVTAKEQLATLQAENAKLKAAAAKRPIKSRTRANRKNSKNRIEHSEESDPIYALRDEMRKRF